MRAQQYEGRVSRPRPKISKGFLKSGLDLAGVTPELPGAGPVYEPEYPL